MWVTFSRPTPAASALPLSFSAPFRGLPQKNVEDDMLRGACPIQVAFPCFIPAILGCEIRVLPDNVIGEEQQLSWTEALEKRLDFENPWFKKYVEFLEALIERAAGRYPISHGAELGPTDLHAVTSRSQWKHYRSGGRAEKLG